MTAELTAFKIFLNLLGTSRIGLTLKFLSMFYVLGSCVVGYNYNKKDALKSQ